MAKKCPEPAPKRPNGPYYYKFEIDGKMYRKCTDTTDRAEARRITRAVWEAAKVEAYKDRLSGGTVPGKAKDMTLNEAALVYWRKHVLRQSKDQMEAGVVDANDDLAREALSGQNEIKRRLEIAIRTIGHDTLISTIDDDAIAKFVAARKAYRNKGRSKHPSKTDKPGKPLSASTRNGEVAAIQGLMKFCHLDQKIPIQIIDWKRFRVAKAKVNKRTRYLSADESLAILKLIRPCYRPIVMFALATGLRLENLVGLVWKDINWIEKTITVIQKGGKEHMIPMTSDIIAILENEKPHKTAADSFVFTYVTVYTRLNPKTKRQETKGERSPITYSGFSSYWQDFQDELAGIGMPRVLIHDLRRTYTTDFVKAAGLSHASVAAGHSSEKVTEEVYKNISAPDRVLAAELAAKMREALGRFVPQSSPK